MEPLPHTKVNIKMPLVKPPRKSFRPSSTETLIKALNVLANDIQSQDGVANAAIAEAAQRMKEMLELLDGAYEIVELYEPISLFNKTWKETWLKDAKDCGASPE